MKKMILSGAIALVTLTMFSCKKDSTTTNNTATSSQWTIDNIVYKGDTTYYADFTGDYVISSSIGDIDTSNNNITIHFGSQPATGTYTVAESYYSPTSTEVGFQISNPNGYFNSTGAPGNTVNVTIANGKMTVTFSNITIIGGITTSETTHVSGTLVATL